jgi:succinoglycan biosynthesis protein ExoV
VILYRWPGASTNFGDELNTILWPRLLPGFFDENPAIRFLGIGSILDRRHPPEPVKLVAGSGYGGYEGKPRLDQTWIIHWVRGPRTAAMLGLPPHLALGDPAILVPAALGLPQSNGNDIGFMPHFESAARGAWRQAAERAGVRLIDPRDHPLDILRAIGRCKLLLSEALHGVIVADALRVPWIPIRPLARVHRAKWNDWADTMDVRPRFHGLPASTFREWAGASLPGSSHMARRWLDRLDHRLEKMPSERLVARAGEALRIAIDRSPQLSSDAVLDRCRSRMLDAVQALSVRPLRKAGYRATAEQQSRRLQVGDDSVYQPKLIG